MNAGRPVPPGGRRGPGSPSRKGAGGRGTVLSVVIPVFNERKTIETVLRRVEDAALPEGMGREIIVVDDLSTDGTREFLEARTDRWRIIFQERNLGKGAAIRAGLPAATGDFVVIQDADMEYDPREYVELLRPLLEDRADVVYGSRFRGGRPRGLLHSWHYAGNRLLTWFSNAFTKLSLTDMETCYKMFTRRVVDDIGPRLVSNRFTIEPEITARIAKARYRVHEVGISYGGRSYAEGKKIGWRDGIAALWAIVRFSLFAD